MTYIVKYKKQNQIFWRKIKNVKGDGFVENYNTRWFILDDETRVEISCEGTVFIFSNARFMSIKKQMEKQVGATIPTDSNI